MALDQDKIRKTINRLSQSLKRKSQWRSVEEVHDLRTRSRRLEAVVQALALDQKKFGHPLLKTMARIFRKAGKVRDMDVLAAFASGLTTNGHIDERDPCLIQLLEHLHGKRKKAALRLQACIAKQAEAAHHGLREFSSWLESRNEAADIQRSQPNATAFASQRRAELAAWPRLTVANMHPFRLKVKALRYTLQMAEGDDTPFVTTLREVTDAIGEWHDWNKLLTIATEVLKRSPNCAVSKAIRSTVSAKRRHALLLANTMRKQHLVTGSHTLSEPATTTLASPSSSEPGIANKAAVHSPQPAATPPSTPENP